MPLACLVVNVESKDAPSRRPGSALAISACAVLAAIAYVLSATSVITKSATADEPLHFASAYARVHLHDYRIDPEDPPLWSWLAMSVVPQNAFSPTSLTRMPSWDRALDSADNTFEWVDAAISQPPTATHGGAAVDWLARSRWAMASLAPLLVGAVSFAAWRLAGPVAAIAGAALIAFDPLILGHAPLVKNDVAITLATTLLAIALVALMRRTTFLRLLAFGACCGIVLTTKFSGVPIFLLALATLLVRALARETWDWPILKRTVQSRGARCLGALAACVVTFALAGCCIWAAYGFRYEPTPEPGRQFNEKWFVEEAAARAIGAKQGRPPTAGEMAAFRPSSVTRAVVLANRLNLLPNAYSIGFLHTYAMSLVRGSFLIGERRDTGWWYYFPLAMLFKTPVASVIASVLGAFGLRRAFHDAAPLRRDAAAVLFVVGGGYLLFAMSSTLNLGVRHVMPLFPLIYIAVAVVFATFFQRRRRAAAWIGVALTLGLIVESGLAWPNYIAFFNAPSGGSRGGLRLLSDSNLDWGQDLPLLAEWQSRHPATRLYLSYFGSVDPSIYGVTYINMIGGYARRHGEPLQGRGVVAISATRLQGVYVPPQLQAFYARFRHAKPREVLGGTIYLFDYPLEPAPDARAITPP